MMRKESADNSSKLNRLKVLAYLRLQDATLSDLAQHLGVSTQHVSDMLRDRRNVGRYVDRIALFLRQPKCELVNPKRKLQEQNAN